MAHIRLEQITVFFNGHRALDELSLQIRHGEILSVLGPSGSGKTTLLKVIAGLITPDEGHVFFGPHDITRLRPRERGVGMLFENISLYPHMDGQGNIAFPLRTRQQPDIEERVAVIARRLEIAPPLLMRRNPTTLSMGEQQRVALGRALVTTPTVLLLDEPLSKLDAPARAATRAQLRHLLDEFDVTTVMVTHDQEQALAMANRIAVMRDGKVEQVGTPGELMLRPKNVFVAQFVGSPPMNILRGAVEGGLLWLRGASGALPLPTAQRHLKDGPVLVGLRPEHLGAESGGPLRVRVVQIEPLFGQRAQLVYGEMADQALVAQLPATVEVQRQRALELTASPEDLRLFDPRDQARLR